MESTLLRWLPALLTAGVLASAGGVRADEPRPLDRKDLDKRLVQEVLKDVTNLGVDQYNSGDWAGCYHTFKAMLLTIKPVIDHRPDLQQAITEGLKQADENPVRWRAAQTLRETIDEVRGRLHDGKPLGTRSETKPETRPTTLWERLGGKDGVTKVVDEFAALALANKKVDFTRGGKYPVDADKAAEMKKMLVEMVSEASGGPLKYTGKSMKEIHKGMEITDEQFDALAADLKSVLEKNGVKPDDVKAVLEAVGKTRKAIVEEKKPESKAETRPETKPRTLFDRIGGEKAATKIADAFIAEADRDPVVNLSRDGKYRLDDATLDKLKAAAAEILTAETGGKAGKGLVESLKGFNLSEDEYKAGVAVLAKVLKFSGVADADAADVVKIAEAAKSKIVTSKAPVPKDDKKPGVGVGELRGKPDPKKDDKP